MNVSLATRASSSRYGRISAAPSAQFSPTASGRVWRTEFQNASVVWPESVRPDASVIVPDTMIGQRRCDRSKNASSAASAALAFSVSNTVSTRKRSTPPSASASIASPYDAASRSNVTLRAPGSLTSGEIDAVRFVGPSAPATKRGLSGVFALRRAAKILFAQALALDHRAHGAVEHQDAVVKERGQLGGSIGLHLRLRYDESRDFSIACTAARRRHSIARYNVSADRHNQTGTRHAIVYRRFPHTYAHEASQTERSERTPADESAGGVHRLPIGDGIFLRRSPARGSPRCLERRSGLGNQSALRRPGEESRQHEPSGRVDLSQRTSLDRRRARARAGGLQRGLQRARRLRGAARRGAPSRQCRRLAQGRAAVGAVVIALRCDLLANVSSSLETGA